jgi:hypothetical protein
MPLRGRVGRHTRDGGRHCQNWPDDQQSVISLLNRIPVATGGAAGSLSKPVISGICGDELYRAISTFEDKYFPGQRSGYLDSAGAMLKRMEDLAAAPAPGGGGSLTHYPPGRRIDFVTPVDMGGLPTGATTTISGTTRWLSSNEVMFFGIVGDSKNVVKTVSPDVPTATTIEDVGVVGGNRWFRLSRPRGDKFRLQAKDAKGTVHTSFEVAVIELPKASGPMDFEIDPADPKRPNTINLRVYAPKDDADYIDTRMTGVGYALLYKNGFQVRCTGMNTPIEVPHQLVDLNPIKAEPIDAKVYDTLAQANEAIRRAPPKAKGVTPFAYYRGAGGAVIAPTIFSAATTPRIIATMWEARRLYMEDAQRTFAGIAIGIAGGMVVRALHGGYVRASSWDSGPPRAALPPSPRIRVLSNEELSMHVGGGAPPPLTPQQVNRAIGFLRNGQEVHVESIGQMRQIQGELGQVGVRSESSSAVIPQRPAVSNGGVRELPGSFRDGPGTYRVDPPHGPGTLPYHSHNEYPHINITLRNGKTTTIVVTGTRSF